MNALCLADLSLPMFRFIFIRRIICSLKLFDSSTSPHSSTLFIAGHSPIAYFRAFLSSSPQPAKSDFRNTSRRSSILLIMSAVFPGLRRSASLSAAGRTVVIPASARVALGLPAEVPPAPAFRRAQRSVAFLHKLRDLLLEGLGDTGHGLVDESLPVRAERLHLVLVETLQVLPALVRYAQTLLQRPDSPVQGVYLVAQLGDCAYAAWSWISAFISFSNIYYYSF